MVESKFKFRSLLTVISSLLLLVILMVAFLVFGMPVLPIYASVLLFILMTFIIVCILRGELRIKAVQVKIEYNYIIIKSFLGLGTTKKYEFIDFDGYKISILPSEYEDYEYLYLVKNQKKIIKISQFYHSNYTEIKQAISKKTKNLGKEDFNLAREIKGIFSV